MRVVGKDATYLNGRDGTDLSYLTNTVYIGPGESVDAIVHGAGRWQRDDVSSSTTATSPTSTTRARLVPGVR